MLGEILENIKVGNFKDLIGSSVSLSVPFTREQINLILQDSIRDKTGIERVFVTSIDKNQIKLNVTLGQISMAGLSFELIDREILLALHQGLTAPDFLLRIEILDGIKRIENEILEILFNTLFENDTIDFENRFVSINHRKLSDNVIYTELLNHIVSAKLVSSRGRIRYDIRFKI